MKQTKSDKRTEKTRKLYEEALITLLKTKDINEITVTDISLIVGMNRCTFYIHYDNIYDLLESVENNLISEFDKLTVVSPIADKSFLFEAAFSRILKAIEFIDGNRELFTVLLNDQGSLSFLSRVKKTFSLKLLSNFYDASSSIDEKYSGILSSFFISGFIGIIQEWLEKDSNISVFELATIIHMILNSNISLMSNERAQ